MRLSAWQRHVECNSALRILSKKLKISLGLGSHLTNYIPKLSLKAEPMGIPHVFTSKKTLLNGTADAGAAILAVSGSKTGRAGGLVPGGYRQAAAKSACSIARHYLMLYR